MAKILIAGAGGAPSEGVIHSLIAAEAGDEIIGMGSEPMDLVLSKATKKYLVPYANQPDYEPTLLRLLEKEKPDLVHFQNDLEIFHASMIREKIKATGTRVFMPAHHEIDSCVHKYKSYLAFSNAGVPVPRNLMMHDEQALQEAFKTLGNSDGKIWLRASSIGGGGKGAIPTADYSLAKGWIDHHRGWGDFVAAEMLTSDTITWLSIWYQGELIVAQTRKRCGWTHGNRSISGVTGVTKVGMTCNDEAATETAIAAISAISDKPHGIYGVDMTYNSGGVPMPTEINISRFFTTIRFFTEAGLNMPEIFRDLALSGKKPSLDKSVNPLPSDLIWARGMDVPPLLLNESTVQDQLVCP